MPKKFFNLKSEEIIVSSIIENNAIDRTTISKITNMSLSNVSRVVHNLIKRGIVEEVGESASSGGRRPILLRFNSEYKLVVGVKIGLGYANVIVTNMIGNVLLRTKYKFNRFTAPEKTIERLIKSSKSLFESQGIDLDKIMGTGIAISGAVDQKNGVLIFSGLLEWREVEIARIVEKITKIPTVVLNDVDSFTLAQLWKGRGQNYRNFLSVTVGTGIGLGIVADGKLYLGLGNAGEFGHIIVNADGEKCSCGRTGCLETEVSFQALIREIRRTSRFKKFDTMLSKIMKNEQEETELQVLRIVQKEDAPVFVSAFERFAKFLGIGLTDLVNVFNPPLIILGGEALEFSQYFMGRVSKYVAENSFDRLGRQVKIIKDSIGEDAWSLGVIYLLIERAFNRNPIIEEVI